ncbi:hypothetical protein Pcinc_011264 [Petrolisthes cinctipes]|uniref:Uncharacterized protein n=1 Tax=Petrolisthes cinctipes TaxID=88211 RepID=A0AAE1KWH7_PETCI|nr:hypothetical protein Pcinc_011264 [Petrolisthes cinctipes]
MKDFVKVCVRLCFLLCQVQGALEILRDGVKVSCLDLGDQSVQYEEVCLSPSILDLENLTCRMAGEIVYQCQDNLNCKGDGALKDKTIPRENTDCQGIPLRSLNNVLGDYTCTSPHGSLAFTPPLCSGALEILRDGVKVSCLDLGDQSVQYEEVCLSPSILDLENLTCRMAGEIVYQCQDNLNCKDDGALKDKTIPRENTDCQGIPLRSLNNVLGDYTCTSPHGSLAFTPPLCSGKEAS